VWVRVLEGLNVRTRVGGVCRRARGVLTASARSASPANARWRHLYGTTADLLAQQTTLALALGQAKAAGGSRSSRYMRGIDRPLLALTTCPGPLRTPLLLPPGGGSWASLARGGASRTSESGVVSGVTGTRPAGRRRQRRDGNRFAGVLGRAGELERLGAVAC
jgi:hypothetical protein